MENERRDVITEQRKPLYIVSDFHGIYDAIKLVKDQLNKGKRVVILGDCMDRGNEGIRLLSEIKKMVENGESVLYLPGNHDDNLYSKVRHFVETYRMNPKELTDEMVEIFIAFMRTAKFTIHARINGQVQTYNEITEMTKTPEGLKEFFELMMWLEEQPLLKIETDCDGKKIALGHAAFDMDLYEMEEPLTLKSKAKLESDYKDLELIDADIDELDSMDKECKKADACLWYRNPADESVSDFIGAVRLPTESEADIIVVGHTPKQGEVEIIGENITRTAIDVDGGTVDCYLSGEGEMLKFEPSIESKPSKTMVEQFVIVGKRGAHEKLGLMDEYEPAKEEFETEESDSDMKVFIPKFDPKKKINQDPDPDDDFGDI